METTFDQAPVFVQVGWKNERDGKAACSASDAYQPTSSVHINCIPLLINFFKIRILKASSSTRMDSFDGNVPTIFGNNKNVLFQAMMDEHDPSITNQRLDASLSIQLAALTHNQQYSHAQHLFDRYKNKSISRNDHTNSREIFFPMFFRLWNALQPLFQLNSAQKEIYITSDSANSSLGHELSGVYDNLKSCQIRNSDDGDPLLFESLVGELLVSIREKVLFTIESGCFETVSKNTVSSLLGFASDEDVVSFCQTRGWKIERQEEEVLLIPCTRDNVTKKNIDLTKTPDKFEYLTKLVGFLETQRLNA